MRSKKDLITQGDGVEVNVLLATVYLVNPNPSVHPGVCRALGYTMSQDWGGSRTSWGNPIEDSSLQHSLLETSITSSN